MYEQENRRASFRLDDTMKIQATALEPEQLDAILQDFEAFRIQKSLSSHFLVQRELRQSSLQLIRKRDPEVAEYFQHLEEQMLLIADRMAVEGESTLSEQSETTVNISSAGICYQAAAGFSLGQIVELRMQLSTSGAQIVSLATVVRIEDSDENIAGQSKYSLSFTHIHADDSEAFIRHMVRLQRIQLQARRVE